MSARFGVEIAGTGRYVPKGVTTNNDLAEVMDTSDEWITQRTGIRQRHVCDPAKGENTTWICTEALTSAMADARIDPSEIEMLILASVTGEMTCPSTACRSVRKPSWPCCTKPIRSAVDGSPISALLRVPVSCRNWSALARRAGPTACAAP